MKKIMVIGCPGSGKSTFSRALHKILGIPIFYLDMMFWNADKTTVERPVFMERLNKVLERDEWIIDGIAIMPDGSNGAPCGACRELMV